MKGKKPDEVTQCHEPHNRVSSVTLRQLTTRVGREKCAKFVFKDFAGPKQIEKEEGIVDV